MFKFNRELGTLLFTGLVVGVGFLVVTQRDYNNNRHVFSESLPIFPSLTPTPETPYPVETTTTDAPDGNKKLILKKEQTKTGVTYSFSTADRSGANEKMVFKKTAPLNQVLTVPYNTWSPNDTYFFLKETTPTVNNYYVFYTSGKSFSEKSQFINIQELFAQKLPQYAIENVTGWADQTLLIVNTKTEQGRQGPSFWFDLTGNSFLQLGTRFN